MVTGLGGSYQLFFHWYSGTLPKKGDKKGGVKLPDCVDGAEGEEEIVEKFREVYETLYNSAESADAVNQIKNSLSDANWQDSLLHVNKITGPTVKSAATKM